MYVSKRDWSRPKSSRKVVTALALALNSALQVDGLTAPTPPRSTFRSATPFDIPQRALCWKDYREHSGLRPHPCLRKESDRPEGFLLPSSNAHERSSGRGASDPRPHIRMCPP